MFLFNDIQNQTLRNIRIVNKVLNNNILQTELVNRKTCTFCIHLLEKTVINKTKQIQIFEHMKHRQHKAGISECHSILKHLRALDG